MIMTPTKLDVLRVLIVDDEPVARELLHAHAGASQQRGTAGDSA